MRCRFFVSSSRKLFDRLSHGRFFTTQTSNFDRLKEIDNARERIVSMLAFALNDIEKERPTSATFEPVSTSPSSSLPSDIDINTIRAIKDTFLTSSSFRLPASDLKDLHRDFYVFFVEFKIFDLFGPLTGGLLMEKQNF